MFRHFAILIFSALTATLLSLPGETLAATTIPDASTPENAIHQSSGDATGSDAGDSGGESGTEPAPSEPPVEEDPEC